MTRVIALGASNLTRGLRTVVSLSRTAWGADTEVIAALGLGRSYGETHQFVVRRLPGILECGVWRALDAMPPAERTIGIIADVGNDILYGYDPDQILSWVGEAASRLQQHTSEIALTGLPIHNVDLLSERRFRLMRSVMFPSSTQTHAGARSSSLRVQAGLEQMAKERALRFMPLQREWYSWDPIHFSYAHWRRIWGGFLSLEEKQWSARPEPGGVAEGIGLWLRSDEHRWICGIHQHTPQRGRIQLF